jgi:hypothetical protein
MNQFFEFEKAVFRFTLARGLFLDNYFGEQSYHSQQGGFTNRVDKYYGFRWKSQENLSSFLENPIKSSKIEIYSWPSWPYGQLQGLGSNVFL